MLGRGKNMRKQPITESYHKIGDSKKAFDIKFWQGQGEKAIFEGQGEKAIFEAARDMVRDYLLLREGYADEPRLQRTLESFQKLYDVENLRKTGGVE
jgi:hypothetical protein